MLYGLTWKTFRCEECKGLTKDLYDLEYSNLTDIEKITNLKELTNKNKFKIDTKGLYYMSLILSEIKFDSSDLDIDIVRNFTTILDEIMDLKEEILTESQIKLNATDNILFSLDNILRSYKKHFSSRHIFLQTANKTSGILGWSLFENRTLLPLMENNSTLQHITESNATASALLSISDNQNCDLVYSFMDTHTLFNEDLGISKSISNNIPIIIRDCPNEESNINITIIVKLDR